VVEVAEIMEILQEVLDTVVVLVVEVVRTTVVQLAVVLEHQDREMPAAQEILHIKVVPVVEVEAQEQQAPLV
jgi:hypothetical protein